MLLLVLAFHYTSNDSLAMILAPRSQGLRAAKVGQHGGGLSVCRTPPNKLEWEPYCGGKFREQALPPWTARECGPPRPPRLRQAFVVVVLDFS